MNMRMILASQDAVAVDTVETLIMGWDPYSIEYLGMVEASGGGTRDVYGIDVEGAFVDEVRTPFAGPTTSFAAGGAPMTDWTGPDVTVRDIGRSASTWEIPWMTPQR